MPHQGNTRWQLGIQHITQSEQKSTFKLGIFLNTKSGSRHRVCEHCEEPRLLAEKQNHNGLTPRGSAATGARKAPGWTPCIKEIQPSNFNIFFMIRHTKVWL